MAITGLNVCNRCGGIIYEGIISQDVPNMCNCREEFNKKMRQFDTGATRDDDTNKYDYEGFLSPLVLERYAQYMHKNRLQSDGKMRDSDNWQKGIPPEQYMKSKLRHIMETWRLHRGVRTISTSSDDTIRINALCESLCAELFNTMGMLFELLNKKEGN